MIRRTLVCVSLVLALGAGTVWGVNIRGPRYTWEWPGTPGKYPNMIWRVFVLDGAIHVVNGPRVLSCGSGMGTKRMGIAGVQYTRVFYGGIEQDTVSRHWRLPLWASVLLFSAYPFVALIGSRARLRHRRRVRGLCVECGYDLTGNVSGKCPECGTEIKQP